MIGNDNLYESLFPDDDDESDVGMMAINDMYGHLNFDAMSNYISLDQYNKSFPCYSNKMLSIFHINIRSYETNLIQLESLLANLTHRPDILALSETWLDDTNKVNHNLEGYSSFHIVREPNKHGGVSLFVRDYLVPENIEKYSYLNSNIEICTVTFKINKISYTVAALYRPSNKYEKILEFRQELAPILKSPIFKKSNTIILVDFNIDLLLHGDDTETNEFMNLMQIFNYTPIITRPTRFPQGMQLGSPALLDHIYVNFTPPSKSGILHFDITDHLPVFLNFHLPTPIKSTYKVRFRIFNEENESNFSRQLALTLWEELLVHDDIDTNFETFFNHFQMIYNKCFPITTKNISAKLLEKPWLSQGLKKFY